MHWCEMFGFHDYTIDLRSGRPQPHHSWLGERLITWTAWTSAAVWVTGALAYYLKWQDMDGPVQMTLASVLFAAIGYWRHRMLIRKRAALRNALEAYEAMLAKPFD